MTEEHQQIQSGEFVHGDVQTDGGNFVGRNPVIGSDKIVTTFDNKSPTDELRNKPNDIQIYGDHHVINITYGNKQTPQNIKQLDQIAEQTGMNEESIIAKGVAIMALALKAQEQGMHLAIVDNEDNVVTEIIGIKGNIQLAQADEEDTKKMANQQITSID